MGECIGIIPTSKRVYNLLFFFNTQAFDITDKTDQKRMYVKRLFSGGDHSFAFATPNNSESYDDRAVEYVSSAPQKLSLSRLS